MPQIATWTVSGQDHAGERRTDGVFRQAAAAMARAYEAAAGLAANTVTFTIRDAAAPDPRTSALGDRLVDPDPPDERTPEEQAIDAILDKDIADRTVVEKDRLTDWVARGLRGR